jgi:hypothetical protein
MTAMRSAANGPPRDEMSVAQNTSARCQRYLGDMGVSLQVWVHAMETPSDRLFVFKTDELKSLNLVTAAAVASVNSPKTLPSHPANAGIPNHGYLPVNYLVGRQI